MENYKTKNIVFSVVFLLSIAMPFPMFLLSGGFDTDNINLILEESPKASVFNALDEDFKGKYGYRESYLQAHNDFKYYLLNESAIPKKVVVGKEGWFFIGNGSSNVINETLKAAVFPLEEKREILKNFTESKVWLDSMDISYYTCVAPCKLSIYPKFYYSGELTGNSKFEDLRIFLEQNDWNLIDLKSKILEKKDSLRLYHKTDTHWNDDGAYLGYLKLMEELKIKYPNLNPINLDEFTQSEKDSVGMDLSFMLGLNNIESRVIYKKSNSNITELKRKYEVPSGFSHEDWEYEIRYKNTNGLPFKVMLVRDSFSRAWLKYLRETFEEVVLIWDWKLRKEMIEKEKPDILIQEIVERDIESFLE
jgi:hypothetical protein